MNLKGPLVVSQGAHWELDAWDSPKTENQRRLFNQPHLGCYTPNGLQVGPDL